MSAFENKRTLVPAYRWHKREQDRARHPPLQRASEKRYYPLQHRVIRGMLAEMGRQVAAVLYVVAMAAIIVGVFGVLQKPILGTADSEYWHCLGVRSFLL